MQYNEKYYIGLDLGTSSVGWAVTDTHYDILRAKGKDMWGIREFDEAKTSADRRTKRISRRSRQRDAARRGLIREYFNDAVVQKDPLFFIRLENSRYYYEDKVEALRDDGKDGSKINALFNDNGFNDMDYFKKYPTIFHLRKAMLDNEPEAFDIRLLYLAVINMFKHRGHFLEAPGSIGGNAGQDTAQDAAQLYDALCENINAIAADADDESAGNDMCLPCLGAEIRDSFTDVITSRDISRKEKHFRITELLGIDKKQKKQSEIIKAICGLKANLTLIFGESAFGSDGAKLEISFSDSALEETLIKLTESLESEQMDIVTAMQSIYQSALLQKILKGEKYLSYARVNDYEKHKSDLAALKKLIKANSAEDYDRMFRSDEKGSYSVYVNSCNSTSSGSEVRKRRYGIKERRQEDLYGFIRKMLAGYPDSEAKTRILSDIEKEQFLPKQLTASNGVIPNHVHAAELKAILDNAEKYHAFLTEKDSSGLTVLERILRLYTFTIPYYIGPLSEKSAADGGNGWVIRKEAGDVLPWNVENKVDIAATRDEFVKRLVRSCTYLNDEKVLPRQSLLYESYCVLNEINNIKLHGEKISVELKQRIYKELFEKGKKVRRKDIERFFVNNGIIGKEDTDCISGIDTEINNALTSYGRMRDIFGERIREDRYRRFAEDIIRIATIYGEDKKELGMILRDRFGADSTSLIKLSENEIKRICGLKFREWGNLSAEFLLLQGADKSTGELRSIIRALWETNDNLMELLSSSYTYKEELDDKKGKALKTLSEIKPEDLEDMYFSAPVRRMIWQTIRILREIENVMGCAPDKIFVEMAKSPDEIKKRTVSRAKTFAELYKNIRDEDRDWKQIIENADADGSIRSKKMYLYLTQMGRCMYTGRRIELSELFTNRYDIDHIYPRHFTKDDNIANNLVLVEKEMNQDKKKDIYPVSESIRNTMLSTWKMLLEKKLITKEKFDRLTGHSPFTAEQLAGFIARQLVETRQGTKGVANILKEIMPDTQVVFSKASNVSDFRHDNKLLKSRAVNDMHHAHDAYLNIVVGNVYDVKFTQDPYNFISKEYLMHKPNSEYHMEKLYSHRVERNGFTAWIPGNDGTIATVKKTLAKPSPLLTRMSFTGHGGIADQTLYSKDKAAASPDAYIPLKESDERLKDVAKYGGFSKASTAYFTLVEYEKKGRKIRSIEAVPIYLKESIEKDESVLISFLAGKCGTDKLSVRYRRINLQSLIKLNGYYLYLTGKTEDRLTLSNATQLFIDQKTVNYIKKLENENSSELSAEDNIELYSRLIEKHNSGIMKNRPNPVADKLISGMNKFEKLSIEEQKKVLLEILKTTAVRGNVADLKLIGASSSTGSMKTQKNIGDNIEFKLIDQSVTGLYEREVDLLTV